MLKNNDMTTRQTHLSVAYRPRSTATTLIRETLFLPMPTVDTLNAFPFCLSQCLNRHYSWASPSSESYRLRIPKTLRIRGYLFLFTVEYGIKHVQVQNGEEGLRTV